MQKKGTVKFVNKDRNLFYQTVKENVNNYFTDNNISKFGNPSMILKSIVLLTGYLGTFIALLIIQPGFGIALLMWTLMGICLAGIGMSVMHDANHGAYSSKEGVNTVMGYTLNLLGGAVFNWKLQHNILHHTYTNITGMDDDIDGKGGMRFSPHATHEKKHRLQFIYAFFMYGLISIYWVTLKDFVQYVAYRKNGVNAESATQYRFTLVKLIGMKIFYFSLFVGVPIFLFSMSPMLIILGFLWMHFVGGIILSVVFQLAHTVEGTAHPLPDVTGTIENCWAIHQMYTTANFSRRNKLLSWYVGGLNFQVEHHLFPRICHVHYPEIAPIIKETAEQFGIPYLENITFMEALRSHVKVLHTLGKVPSLDTIID